MNRALLRYKMEANGETQSDLAAVVGIAPATLSYKLNSGKFVQREIMAIKEHYSLTADEIDAIFFSTKAS